MMARPPVTVVRQRDTHRLIPSRHLARGDSVLSIIANDEANAGVAARAPARTATASTF